jgi:hypothetical protein
MQIMLDAATGIPYNGLACLVSRYLKVKLFRVLQVVGVRTFGAVRFKYDFR